jgi:hypothetical protein
MSYGSVAGERQADILNRLSRVESAEAPTGLDKDTMHTLAVLFQKMAS